MADIVPTQPTGSSLTPINQNPALLGLGDNTVGGRVRAFFAQPMVRRLAPVFGAAATLGVIALVWSMVGQPEQRLLYSSLSDSERAEVVAALDQANIKYAIDSQTGALTVAEDDLYRARMLVASNGSLATPDSGTEMLDKLPMGASRTLEGDRLRAAQQRELELTISEIDGVESVRVHIATAERSVFVRDEAAPKASVMLRLARGRQLTQSQVAAIVNLVAASVPGLAVEDVRVVDQGGRLLSKLDDKDSERLELQMRMEDKLRTQIEQLLSPMFGRANFSSEIQVSLDMAEITTAREAYDKEGVVRRESTSAATSPTGGTAAIGIPGATTNLPPDPANAVPGGPPNQAAGAQGQGGQLAAENSASRTYELGREVAVSSNSGGKVNRLTVAVAVKQELLKGARPAEIQKIEDLVSAAVGADPARGDIVTVIARPFDTPVVEDPPFWETPLFSTILRHVVTIISVLLVLFLGVRPLLKMLRGDKGKKKKGKKGKKGDEDDDEDEDADTAEADGLPGRAPVGVSLSDSAEAKQRLTQQVELAQRIVKETPDSALVALRRMLADKNTAGGSTAQ